MKFRVSHGLPIFLYRARHGYLHNQRRCFTSFFKKLQTTTRARTSFNGGTGPSRGQPVTSPIATFAYLLETFETYCTCYLFGCLENPRIEKTNWNSCSFTLHYLLLIFYGSVCSKPKATFIEIFVEKIMIGFATKSSKCFANSKCWYMP